MVNKSDKSQWFISWYATLSPGHRRRVDAELLRRAQEKRPNQISWPNKYVNSDTGRPYKIFREEVSEVLYSDTPRNILVKGGEGSGKSALGVEFALNRLRRGMSGIAVSPDGPHFKKSLWPEMRRWIPWECVVKKHQYRQSTDWTPNGFFVLVFKAEVGGFSTLYCGGIDDPAGWEGPNVHFALFDEARRKREPDALKVLSGRVRLTGPQNEPPQVWLTTTPRKHWLFDYFGPLKPDDPMEIFKKNSTILTLKTIDNIENLSDDYIEQRGASLTEKEKRILLNAEWEEDEDTKRFLASMSWWDGCEEPLPALSVNEPMVIALDAGVSNDTFAMVGVTRHPDPAKNETSVAIRYSNNWVPPPNGKIDFSEPEQELRRLIATYNVVMVCYDPYQLHDMGTRLAKEGIAWFYEFSQGGNRLEADKQLLDLILARRISHDGTHSELYKHIDNADVRTDTETRKLRLVKRSSWEKIDLCVAASMSVAECLRLNL